MEIQQLFAYIEQQLSQGQNVGQIKKTLQQKGWQLTDIEKGFELYYQRSQNIDPNTQEPTDSDFPTHRLLSATELLKKSFEIFKQIWGKLVVINLIGTVITSSLAFFLGGSIMLSIFPFYDTSTNSTNEIINKLSGLVTNNFQIVIAIGFLIIILIIFISTWMYLAQLYLASRYRKNPNLKQIFSNTKNLVPSFIWLNILFMTLIWGGFVLLIVPAFFLAVWSMLYYWVFIDERKGGHYALLKSKYLIRGKVGSVFGRMFVVMIVFVAISFIFSAPEIITQGNTPSIVQIIIGILNFVLNVAAMPFVLIYSYLIYENLKSMSSSNPFQITTKSRISYIVISLIGLITFGLMFGIPAWGAYTQYKYFNSPEYKQNQAQQELEFTIDEVKSTLTSYSLKNYAYPVTLDELTKDNSDGYYYISDKTIDKFTYIPDPDYQNYQICYISAGGVQECETGSPIFLTPTTAPINTNQNFTSPSPIPLPSNRIDQPGVTIPPGWLTYTNNQLRISFSYPPDWKLDEAKSMDYPYIKLLDPVAQNLQPGQTEITDGAVFEIYAQKTDQVKTPSELVNMIPLTDPGQANQYNITNQFGTTGLMYSIHTNTFDDKTVYGYGISLNDINGKYILDFKMNIFNLKEGNNSNNINIYNQILDSVEIINSK